MALPSIGKVKSMLFLPCANPPQLWVSTFIPAAISAVSTLLTPDNKELVRLATGKSWLKNLKTVVREATVDEGTAYDGALKTFFRLTEYADAASWYFFLTSIGADFLADWTSLTYKVSGCQPAQKSWTTAGGLPVGIFNADGNWATSVAFTESNPTPGQPLATLVSVAYSQKCYYNLAIVWHTNNPLIADVEWKVQNVNTGEVVASGGSGLFSVISVEIDGPPVPGSWAFQVYYRANGPIPIGQFFPHDGNIGYYIGAITPYL